jgi:hypothetical protein
MEIQRNKTLTVAGGLLLIMFGALFLVGQFVVDFDFWHYFWPVIVAGIGVACFGVMLAGGKAAAGLAIPGSILSAIGVMMFFQNLTDHWESWAYGWTVIVMAVGAGLYLMGAQTGREAQRQSGLRVLTIGAALFVVFGAFFEMLFSGMDIARFAFPVLFILLGIYLVITRSGLLAGRRRPGNQPAEALDKPTAAE